MSRDFARAFYNSPLWKKVRADYANSKLFMCERCGGRGEIVHHKIHLTPANINTHLATDFNNLELLCRYCHGQIHNGGYSTVKDVFFTPDGDVISPPIMKGGGGIFHTAPSTSEEHTGRT